MFMGIVLAIFCLANGYNAIYWAAMGHIWTSIFCAFASGFCAATSLITFLREWIS